MQIFVRLSEGLRAIEVDKSATVDVLQRMITCIGGVPFALPHEPSELVSSVFSDLSTINASISVLGGAKDLSEEDKALAYNRVAVKICRVCYSRNAIKATVCRKKSCGHSKNLRPKKMGKGVK